MLPVSTNISFIFFSGFSLTPASYFYIPVPLSYQRHALEVLMKVVANIQQRGLLANFKRVHEQLLMLISKCVHSYISIIPEYRQFSSENHDKQIFQHSSAADFILLAWKLKLHIYDQTEIPNEVINVFLAWKVRF